MARTTARADEAGAPGVSASGHASPADSGLSGRGGGRRTRWGGAGGRWWIWVGRAVLWAFIIVVVVNGIRAPFERMTAPSSGATPAAGGHSDHPDFPRSQVSAFALEFAATYLDYDARTARSRSHRLSSFVDSSGGGQFGWNGKGTSHLDSAQVADVRVTDDRHATVLLTVRVNGRWMQLSVPVYTSGGAMVVDAKPALLPPPKRAGAPTPPDVHEDSAVQRQLTRQLPAFFKAYAAGDSVALQRFAAGDVSFRGLGGAVRFAGIRDVSVPTGGGTRHATVTVAWRMPNSGSTTSAGALEQSYDLTIVRDGGKWDIRRLQGSAQPAGS